MHSSVFISTQVLGEQLMSTTEQMAIVIISSPKRDFRQSRADSNL